MEIVTRGQHVQDVFQSNDGPAKLQIVLVEMLRGDYRVVVELPFHGLQAAPESLRSGLEKQARSQLLDSLAIWPSHLGRRLADAVSYRRQQREVTKNRRT